MTIGLRQVESQLVSLFESIDGGAGRRQYSGGATDYWRAAGGGADRNSFSTLNSFQKKNSRGAAQAARKQAEKTAPRSPRKRVAPRSPHKRYPGGKRPYVPKSDTRLARQREMKLPEMLAELPQQCDLGRKKDSRGNDHYWRGSKLPWDVADGQIPISVVLTSASVHDSQVAIPLATMSTQRVTYCYALMDAAYDAHHIIEQSRQLGHVPIVILKLRADRTVQPRQSRWAGRSEN